MKTTKTNFRNVAVHRAAFNVLSLAAFAGLSSIGATASAEELVIPGIDMSKLEAPIEVKNNAADKGLFLAPVPEYKQTVFGAAGTSPTNVEFYNTDAGYKSYYSDKTEEKPESGLVGKYNFDATTDGLKEFYYESNRVQDATPNGVFNSASASYDNYSDASIASGVIKYINTAASKFSNSGYVKDLDILFYRATQGVIASTSPVAGVSNIINRSTGTIDHIRAEFIDNNSAYTYQVLFKNKGSIKDMEVAFVDNRHEHNRNVYSYYEDDNLYGYSGVYNFSDATIDNLKADFLYNNSNTEGEFVIANEGTIGSINANFIGNKMNANLIENYGKITDGVWNSVFVDNTTNYESANSIYTNSDITVGAKGNGLTIFDNKVGNINAIYTDQANLKLVAKTGGKMIINDRISGNGTYNLDIDGDDTGAIYLNNNIQANKLSVPQSLSPLRTENQDPINITLNRTNLILSSRENVLDGNNLNLNSGTLSMANGHVGVSNLKQLTVSGHTDFVADVDLENREMDRFVVTGEGKGNIEKSNIEPGTYGAHASDKYINVIGMNLLSDADFGDKNYVAVYFAEPGLKNNVRNALAKTLKDNRFQGLGNVKSPIYSYNVYYDKSNQYDNKGDGGYFVFAKGGTTITPDGSGGASFEDTGNPSDNFNPAVLTTSVANQAAGQAVMSDVYKYVFEHVDAFTQLPASVRTARMNQNRYALSTDYNENLGSLDYSYDDNNAIWLRPFTSFEKINLKNGPKVDAITYGSLVGYDTDFRYYKNGWRRLGTGYLGYIGSQLSYKDVDTSMNGGVIGLTETFYKNNFWSALTVSVGAGVADTKNMYGHEDATMLMAGVASKTGYNFEFKEGKYILQPIMQLSYTFVNTFDYTNSAGIKIDSDPMHSIQLNPSIRFVNNRDNGWQPYAQVGMNWNLMNESKAKANGVNLPSMHTKPYIEYGVGVQRNWGEKYTGFLQAMVRNGGRTGIALSGGFRWAVGRDEQRNPDKVQNAPTKKIVKQLDQDTKTVLMNKSTTRTANKAVIKSL